MGSITRRKERRYILLQMNLGCHKQKYGKTREHRDPENRTMTSEKIIYLDKNPMHFQIYLKLWTWNITPENSKQKH